MSLVIIVSSTGLQDFVRVWAGERAVTLLFKGSTRLLTRAVSSVLSRSTYLVGCARFTK